MRSRKTARHRLDGARKDAMPRFQASAQHPAYPGGTTT